MIEFLFWPLFTFVCFSGAGYFWGRADYYRAKMKEQERQARIERLYPPKQ